MNIKESSFGEEFKVLIQERIKSFWGYGNLNAPYWFIGMEEGYNAETEDLYKRFKASEGKKICDVADLKIDAGSYSLLPKVHPSIVPTNDRFKWFCTKKRVSYLITKQFGAFRF